MIALIKNKKGIVLENCTELKSLGANEVQIEVKMVGLCRTDWYVANGVIQTKTPLILGHECCGIISKIGSDITNCQIGDFVTIMPMLPCGKCSNCDKGDVENCPNYKFLGLHEQGVLTNYINIPRHIVYKVPTDMSYRLAAFSEPVAAALAIFTGNVNWNSEVVILGNNRFSRLIQLLIKYKLDKTIEIIDNIKGLSDRNYDVLIETGLEQKDIDFIIKTIRPGGTILLRSRNPKNLLIAPIELIKKQINIEAVGYGAFDHAIQTIYELKDILEEIMGPVHSIENFQKAFIDAEQDDFYKHFIEITK